MSLFVRKFSTIAAIALLILSFLTGVAQADTAIPLDTTNEVVNVITVYPTPSNQAQVLADISQGEPKFSKTPGFQHSAILKAQDGTQVVALSQWRGKLSGFQSYAKHVPDVATQTPQTFACKVQHIETRTTSPSFNQGDAIMFSRFKMKPGKDQSELATIVTQEMPSVLQMIPGLQWAAMCPSTDESVIALLARWNSREDFESLGQQPGFDKETNYWQTYAENEHGLYDVVQIQ